MFKLVKVSLSHEKKSAVLQGEHLNNGFHSLQSRPLCLDKVVPRMAASTDHMAHDSDHSALITRKASAADRVQSRKRSNLQSHILPIVYMGKKKEFCEHSPSWQERMISAHCSCMTGKL